MSRHECGWASDRVLMCTRVALGAGPSSIVFSRLVVTEFVMGLLYVASRRVTMRPTVMYRGAAPIGGVADHVHASADEEGRT